jgi:anti-anti-sigma regulatory factor
VFTTEIDQSQNLLVVRYGGRVTTNETSQCLKEMGTALSQLPSGFRLLADLSDLQSMDVSCAPHITQIMELCNKAGVDTVIRVVPDPKRDIGLQIMSYFHYGSGVRIATCETLAQAINMLSEENAS